MSNRWWSLDELNDEAPDHDHPSTVDSLFHLYDLDALARCWRKENVATLSVDPGQLIDDPDDADGEAKVEAIRQSIRGGAVLPAVVTIHHPELVHPYVLIEGRHRYNAAHREASPWLRAWVAHPGCCGSPHSADQMQAP